MTRLIVVLDGNGARPGDAHFAISGRPVWRTREICSWRYQGLCIFDSLIQQLKVSACLGFARERCSLNRNNRADGMDFLPMPHGANIVYERLSIFPISTGVYGL